MTSNVYSVVNPATGTTAISYPTDSHDDIDAALTRATAAHRSQRKTALGERVALIRRVAELHEERLDYLAELIVEEMGKPISQARDEVAFSASIYIYYADHAPELLRDQPLPLDPKEEGSAYIRRASLGVILGIMPWNFPYYQVARFAGPNVVAGNTVLLKHAPQCPRSSAAIAQIFADAGAASGVYENLYASHAQIETLIADPRVAGVSLTGSERAGAAVAEVAGRHLKKVVLELGGSDPFILLSTDDLEATVRDAADARLDNTGQSCNAAKRFIVHEDLYDPFVQRLAETLGQVDPGDPADPDTTLGPVSSSAAADRLEAQVNTALARGATAVTPFRRTGNFVWPTILTNVTKDNPAYGEEFFGPVAIIHSVASEDAAIELANDTPYGLGSYVYTTDPEQAQRVSDQLDVGMVFVNMVGGDAVELPFGGVKRSGIGREMGPLGIEEFLNRKLIRIPIVRVPGR